MPLVERELIPNSRRAMEATEYARAHGKHDVFHKAVFHLYFGEGKNIGSWDVLAEAAKQAGLDPDEMRKETEEGKHTPAWEASVTEARQIGVTGIPTFVLEGKYGLVGLQPIEVFREAIGVLTAEFKQEQQNGNDSAS